MPDREKVEQGIKACWSEYFFHKCCNCPYMQDRNDRKCVERLGADTIALLKEQESEYEKGFNDAMLGKQELMYEGTDGKWHKKDW